MGVHTNVGMKRAESFGYRVIDGRGAHQQGLHWDLGGFVVVVGFVVAAVFAVVWFFVVGGEQQQGF